VGGGQFHQLPLKVDGSFPVKIMTEVPEGAAICVRTSPPRSEEQVDSMQPVVVLYELTNLRIAKTLARLGLPGQDSICRYGFIEVVRSLPATERHEKHSVSRPIRDADDARDAPGPTLGPEHRVRREDVMDFFTGVHLPRIECSHSISSRPLSGHHAARQYVASHQTREYRCLAGRHWSSRAQTYG
jgi:hypothetical protein